MPDELAPWTVRQRPALGAALAAGTAYVLGNYQHLRNNADLIAQDVRNVARRLTYDQSPNQAVRASASARPATRRVADILGVSRMSSTGFGQPPTRTGFRSRRSMPRIGRMIKSLTQPYTVRDIKANNLIAYPGTQAFVAWNHLDPAMLTDMRGRLNVYDNIASTQGLTGNSSVLQPYAGIDNKCAFSSYTCRTTFTNNSTVGVEMTIYDVVPRRDLTNAMFYEGPVVNGTTYLPIQWAGTPISALQTYSSEASGLPTTAPLQPGYPPATQADMNLIQNGYMRYGFSPNQSALFRAYFKIRAKHIHMQPGGSHVHTISLSPNIVLDNLKLRSMQVSGTNTMTAYAGLTSWTMIRIRGYKALSWDGVNHTTTPARIDIDSDRVRVGRIYRRLLARTENLTNRTIIVPKPGTSVYTQHINVARGVVQGDNFISTVTRPVTEEGVDGEGEDDLQRPTEDINPEEAYVDYSSALEPNVLGAGDTINEVEVANHGNVHGPQSPSFATGGPFPPP